MKARIQHVSIPRPPDSDKAARAFYGRGLGLEEVAPPATLEGVIWYKLGDTELHLYIGDLVPEGSRQHFCIAVDGLEALRQRLAAAGVEMRDSTPIPGRPRFFITDPFGNRLELTQIVGDYLNS